MMKRSQEIAKAWYESPTPAGEDGVNLAAFIARKTGCDEPADEKLKQGEWNVEKISPSDKPSERAAKRLQTSGFADRRSSTEIIAGIIAEQTGCDERGVEPEVDWNKAFPLPFAALPLGAVSCRLVAANSSTISSAERGTAKAAVLAHIAEVVNRDVERAEVGEWVKDVRCVNLPWKVTSPRRGVVRIESASGRDITTEAATGSELADAYDYLVDHVNRLPGRDGCPNAPDGV